jgi:hypothetical protein
VTVASRVGHVPVAWWSFLRALAPEIDGQFGAAARETLLRAVGQQMTRLHGLPQVNSLGALELEINFALAAIGWGSVHLMLDEKEHGLIITHADMPRIGSAGEPEGSWLAAVLEGLYEGWMSQQEGADPSFVARRRHDTADQLVVIRYGRQ